jgi:tetratricopeptide (TPR) repeat protein
MRLLSIIIIFSLIIFTASAEKYDNDSLLQILNLTEQPSKKVAILNLLSKSYLEQDRERSLNFANQALFISESIGNELGKAEAMYYLGILSLKASKVHESLEYAQNAKLIFQKFEDDKWIAKTNLILGEGYFLQNHFEKSLEVLYDARTVFTNLKKENKLAETYNLIGINYYEQGQYKKSFDYLQNGLFIVENQQPSSIKASIINNIANLYLANNNFLEAKKYYDEAIEINNFIKKEDCLGINFAHLGQVYLELGNLDSAAYCLEIALDIHENNKDNYLLAIIKFNLGKLYKSKGEFDKAAFELRECYQLAVNNSILHVLINVTLELSNLYAEKANFEKALFYHQQYKSIYDSVQSIQNSEKITRLEMELIFKHEEDLKTIAYRKSNLKYFTLVLVLLTILIIIIVLYTRLKMRTKKSMIEAENLKLEKSVLRDKLDYKNRELTTNLMYLLKKNELINVISSRLQKGKANFTEKNKKEVQQIIYFLQSNTDKNIWTELEERFLEIHEDFYPKLNLINPNLTQNDKKLCTFIALNLSTKEIASITHQNLNSIEVSRTRLRKKLNITNKNINLHSFLTNL